MTEHDQPFAPLVLAPLPLQSGETVERETPSLCPKCGSVMETDRFGNVCCFNQHCGEVAREREKALAKRIKQIKLSVKGVRGGFLWE